jgi:hypothetical protein
MHTAGLKGEPLAAVQSEIRKERLETLGSAIGALGTVAVGLTQAMKTLEALQSETSDFPLNLPVHDLGQSVPTEHDRRSAGADRIGSATGSGWRLTPDG